MSPTKSLVIVESPHKATMIAGYLGPKYTVRASQGHVRPAHQRIRGSRQVQRRAMGAYRSQRR